MDERLAMLVARPEVGVHQIWAQRAAKVGIVDEPDAVKGEETLVAVDLAERDVSGNQTLDTYIGERRRAVPQGT